MAVRHTYYWMFFAYLSTDYFRDSGLALNQITFAITAGGVNRVADTHSKINHVENYLQY